MDILPVNNYLRPLSFHGRKGNINKTGGVKTYNFRIKKKTPFKLDSRAVRNITTVCFPHFIAGQGKSQLKAVPACDHQQRPSCCCNLEGRGLVTMAKEFPSSKEAADTHP
jgi:hypothetical protein